MKLQCVMPYKGLAAALPYNANSNIQLARLRIVVEQVMGLVKERFYCLAGLRIRIDKAEDMESSEKWVIACFTFHNLCFVNGDAKKHRR